MMQHIHTLVQLLVLVVLQVPECKPDLCPLAESLRKPFDLLLNVFLATNLVTAKHFS
jgi:hypothetical protein